MKRIQATVAILLAVLAGTAQAHIQTFTGTLAPEASSATGNGSVTVDYEEEMHALTITTSFSGLSGATTVAHIHCCVPTPGEGTAIIAVKPPTLDDFPIGVQFGTYSGTFDLSADGVLNQAFINVNGGTKATAEAALVKGLLTGRAYLNIHTSPNFGGGEIRAFLAPVPEPGTWLLMAAGAGVLGLIRRRDASRTKAAAAGRDR